MFEHYNRDGQPITTEQWSQLWSEEYKRVGLRKFDNGIIVSTVWLGINHGFGGAPEIFETMIFHHPHFDDEPCVRYATEIQALWGHAKACEDIEHGRVPWFMKGEV